MLVDVIGKILALFAGCAYAMPVGPNPGFSDPAEFSDLGGVVVNLVKVVLALSGIASFIYILAGAFSYITSGGDDKAIMKAKATLTYAIAGLIVVVASYFIVQTIFGPSVLKFKGITSPEFTLP